MDTRQLRRLGELAGQGEWDAAAAIAAQLIASFEAQPASDERDQSLVHVLQVRSYVHAMAGDLPAAIADGRAALDILYGAAEPDDLAIALVLYSHTQHLAEFGDAAAVRRLDHRPMAALRQLLDGLPRVADPARAGLAAQVSGYAAALHMIGDHEAACDCDRQALGVLRECAEILGAAEWHNFFGSALNLSEYTTDATEAKEVAAEAVRHLNDFMNAGVTDALFTLVNAMYLLGIAQQRLGEEDAIHQFVDAKHLLKTFRLGGPEAARLADAIRAQITSEERGRGWYMTPEVAEASGVWLRMMRAT